ncbi:Lrp/AsnC family transcriptional regulator [Homoserinibacter sp. YIM 151385]|uniref:Lrp/AsnC family transcriptional regulator n=1 Tax=Homoserinibacter sp. YIM 151385 TaxID=2985506 RepID=UPI0022F0B4B0|nr:Lrp/AsnC family transcriptional regulator [Homoserinibacter sp. YIM 151385]WBU37328.1 Lrp/AsnC family transcriptional regulator [Homoserinibacter sp. YIM 151385]
MLDDLDRRLVSLLRADARMPIAALARELQVNRATVTSRIERLVASGAIEAFTVRLANEVDRDAVRGVTMVRSEPSAGQDIVRAARGLPEVEHIHSTLGRWDLVIQLRTATMTEFDVALERIRTIPGVRDTETSLLFTSLTGR